MKNFISKHSVRLTAILAALVPLLVSRWPGIPWEAIAGAVAAVLGLGEVAQRHQDGKTADTADPASDGTAEALHDALAEIERLKAAYEPDTAPTS